jgi:hypothetical protein
VTVARGFLHDPAFQVISAAVWLHGSAKLGSYLAA